MKKTMVILGAVVLASLAVAMVVKLRSPQIKDSYFDPDTDKLRVLPLNLVGLRPTHFPNSSAKVRHVHDATHEFITRTLGRAVPLRDAIAEAWDCNPVRVVLPPEAPKGNFDFLVTTESDARQRLQRAIQKQLGYKVHRET